MYTGYFHEAKRFSIRNVTIGRYFNTIVLEHTKRPHLRHSQKRVMFRCAKIFKKKIIIKSRKISIRMLQLRAVSDHVFTVVCAHLTNGFEFDCET